MILGRWDHVPHFLPYGNRLSRESDSFVKLRRLRVLSGHTGYLGNLLLFFKIFPKECGWYQLVTPCAALSPPATLAHANCQGPLWYHNKSYSFGTD